MNIKQKTKLMIEKVLGVNGSLDKKSEKSETKREPKGSSKVKEEDGGKK